MLRINRSPLAWLALCGLMAPAAARADLPSAWPVQPATGSASSSATQTSYYADDPPAQSDLVPSAAEPPATLQPSAATLTTATVATTAPSCQADPSQSVMPGGITSGFGDCRNRCWQPFIGVEAVLLAPVTNKGGGGDTYGFGTYNFNPAAVGVGNPIGAPIAATTNYSSSVNGLVVTPRIWMGVMGECWGFGVRYWRFANSSGGETAALGPGSSVFQQGALKLQTFDLEAIRRFCCCGNQFWISGGVRYGQFERNSTVQAFNYAGPLTFTGAASSGSGFNGVGPTIAIYGLKPIGCSCWNLFYSARGSYLYSDNSTAFAQTDATFNVTAGGAGSVGTNVGNASGSNGNAWIGELQLGAQYNHQMTCFPGVAFFRISGEYQYWHINNGATANSSSYSGVAAGPVFAGNYTTASAGNSTLGLLGVGLSTGFMW
jgi:hypothetical protein